MEETRTESISIADSHLISYALFFSSFLIPFFISGPQLLVGIVVNMVLYLFVRFFGLKRTIPLLVLPSIGATLNGVVFGVFSPYLMYFMPFIWLGNFVMVYLYDRYRKKRGAPLAVCISALSKAILLLFVAIIFVHNTIVPPLFIQAMSMVQFATAVVGGMLAVTIERIILKHYDRR
jgi:hypothetical protein